MSIAFFWLEIIIYEVILMLRESVGLEPVINTYQLPIHSDMNFVNEIKALMSLSDVKTVVLRILLTIQQFLHPTMTLTMFMTL